jgi:UDP-glucose 4-epimerase
MAAINEIFFTRRAGYIEIYMAASLKKAGHSSDIYVEDLAREHIAALNFLPRVMGLRTLNLGTEISYSSQHVIDDYKEACGKNIRYKIIGKSSGGIASYYAALTKAKRKSGRDLLDICVSKWALQQHLKNSQ